MPKKYKLTAAQREEWKKVLVELEDSDPPIGAEELEMLRITYFFGDDPALKNKYKLTAAQRQEWKKWSAGFREIDYHIDAFELESLRDIHFFGSLDASELGLTSYEDCWFGSNQGLFFMVFPALTEKLVMHFLNDMLVNDRGNQMSRFPLRCETMHRHGVDVLQGRTGWLVELLARGVTDWPRFYMHFYSGELFAAIKKWLQEGGYHQSPMIEVFPYLCAGHFGYMEKAKWNEKDMAYFLDWVAPIFNFHDPENLPSEKSAYYAFAAYAQDYLCHQIEMPKPLADTLTEKLGIKSLAKFKCLPLLARPVYEIPAPAVVPPKSAAKKKEREVYDEFYEVQIDSSHPYPTPRFYARTDLEPVLLLNSVVEDFIHRGFLTRTVKPKQRDVSGLLSAEYVKTPPKSWNAHFVAFKTHPRFAMNDEFEVRIRLAASAEPLTIANGEYNDTVTWKLELEDDTCNLVIDIDAPEGQVLDDDTSAMKNLRAILKSLSENLDIKFKISKPPEILDSWEV